VGWGRGETELGCPRSVGWPGQLGRSGPRGRVGLRGGGAGPLSFPFSIFSLFYFLLFEFSIERKIIDQTKAQLNQSSNKNTCALA
jgi:hypothetical protein